RLRWESQERLRALAQHVQQRLQLATVLTTNLWLDFRGQRWFAMLDSAEFQSISSTDRPSITLTNRITKIRFFPERAVKRAAESALSRTGMRMPEYLQTELSLEGERTGSALAGNPSPLLLAQGEGRLSLPGAMLLSANASETPPFAIDAFPSQPHFS